MRLDLHKLLPRYFEEQFANDHRQKPLEWTNFRSDINSPVSSSFIHWRCDGHEPAQVEQVEQLDW